MLRLRVQIEAIPSKMAEPQSPTLGYIIVYVVDVAKSIDFYSSAFGYTVRRLDRSHRWGELESGPTTKAFTPLHQRETEGRTGAVQPAEEKGARGPVEVCFDYADVDAAYERAVEKGAVPMSPPEVKELGQRLATSGTSTATSSDSEATWPNHVAFN